MAEQEKLVRIVAWPEEQAKLEHHFVLDEPCPVSITFDEKTSAHVVVHSTSEQPLHVNMAMNVAAKEAIPVCIIDFKDLNTGTEFTQPFTHQQLVFRPLGNQIRTATFGDPPGQVKLAFPREGIRTDFPQAVNDVKLTVNNYAGRTLHFFIFAGNILINQFTEHISNEVKEVTILQSGITAVEIKDGNNEASVVEVCFSLA